MVSQYLDLTNELAAGSGVIIDIGEWDYAVVQLVSPSGTVTFRTSNDSGAVQSVSDGSAVSATNFVDVQGTNLTSGSAVTTLATSGIIKFPVIGRYLQLTGTTLSATKLLVKLSKIE